MKRVEAETRSSEHVPLLFRSVQPAQGAGSVSNAGSAGSKKIHPCSHGTGSALQKAVQDLPVKESLVE